MAKTTRTGLGRGLNSLLGGPDIPPVQKRNPNRDNFSYNAREDVIVDEDGKKIPVGDGSSPEITGRIPMIGNPRDKDNVSRETSKAKPATKVREITPERVQVEKEEPKKAPVPHVEIVEEVEVEVEPAEKPAPEKKASKQAKVSKESKESSAAELLKELKDVNNVILDVDIETVEPNPEQPRTNFNQESLDELAASIKRNGLIQPILVRQMEDGKYQIIAGERRWQASKLAGMDSIQVQVKDITDEKALELAMVENIQRADLNPIEEAYGYKRLMERNKMTQADIAQAVSKGRSTVANALRLLELPEDAQQLLFEGKITAGHARAILSITSKSDRSKLAQKIVDNSMTVRDAEALARLMENKPEKREARAPMPAMYKSVALTLKTTLKTPVKIKSSKGKNKIEIEFKDERDLERLFDLINPD